MTQNAELIKEARERVETLFGPGNMPICLQSTAKLIIKLVCALQEQPFDVYRHLQKGGEIRRPCFNPDERWFAKNGYLSSYNGVSCRLASWYDVETFNDWQPYHEPPADGSREWAMGQDAKVTHETWCNAAWINFSTKEQYFGGSTYSTAYDTGWSLYVEPREPGWYSGIWIEGDSVSAYRWCGRRWWVSGVSVDCSDDNIFHWIGTTRIELEAPDVEA